MPAIITLEQADSPDAGTLIVELEAELAPLYPAESRHGYSVERLLAEKVHFFLMREDTIPVGCGGVQFMGREYAEVKRMFVRPPYRGRGLARQMLEHLIDFTRSHGIPLLRLETGIHQEAAIRLYERMGFHLIPPFGDYREDPLSRFYERRIFPAEDGKRVSFEDG